MFLCDNEIDYWAKNGGVEPYLPDNINPASIDLCWSGKVKRYVKGLGWSETMEVNEYKFYPDEFYLLDTLEYLIIPPHLAGFLLLKSSIARMGIESSHACWFDPGFEGTATLEISSFCPDPVTLHKGQRIIQMCVARMSRSPEKTYKKTGRYVGQRGPTPAK